jgi:hypothetical protein
MRRPSPNITSLRAWQRTDIMHNMLARIFACVLIAGALLCAPAFADLSCAQEGTRVVLVPASATVGEGMTAAVEVRVENVQNLYGLDIRIAFDPAVVEVVDADPGRAGIQVRPGDLLSVDFLLRDTADNAAGTVWYALAQLNPSQPVTGSGTAFIIVFKGKQRGATSPLTITYQQLADQTGTAITATAISGEIRVVEPAQAPPTPTTAPPATQPTVQMPTPEPTQAQPTATLTAPPTATAPLPTPEPTPQPPPAQPTPPAPAATATEAPISTATQAATQTVPAAQSPQPTVPVPTAAATQPPPTQPATSTPEPQGSQGGLVLRDILAGVAAVLVVTMMGGITWAVVRSRKPPKQ